MKIESDENNDFVLEDVFNPLIIKAPRQVLSVAQRDGCLEIGLQREVGGIKTVVWYRAVAGHLEKL